MKKRILALLLCIVMCMSTVALLSGCGGGNDDNKTTKPDALVLMSEELDGLFNPFYSTTAADGTIVSMTQIGMITNKYVNGEIEEAFGDDEATVVKDYESVYSADKDETTYTFVIKNGIKYSDGKPLTMHDVLFNLYVYLDPVYTGSSTMYSTDIKGLKAYRTQSFVDDDDTSADDAISQGALTHANNRVNELINLFKQVGEQSGGSYYADYNTMISAIASHTVNDGYIEAIYTEAEIAKYEADGSLQDKARAQLKADYENTVKLFKEELERDYAAAKDSYTEDPYKSAPIKETAGGNVIGTGFNEIISFMYAEGFVTINYEEGADGKIDRTKIKEAILDYNTEVVKDMASAVKYVYDSKVSSELNIILTYWATANTLKTEYAAKGKEILLASNAATNGECSYCGHQNNAGDKACSKCQASLLAIPNISGIVSLGHTNSKGTQIQVNGTTYTVANDHNADGTVKAEGEYDILQITINGVDPKAIWNFAFAVAPQHYYSPNQIVDISKNRFGVEYGSFDFMKSEIQSTRNVKVPLGAGAYQATNSANTDADLVTGFYSNNVVYFKRNEYFNTVGTMENAKIEKIRYRVTSASNALNDLSTGAVHYISPQYTPYNMEQLQKLADKGIVNMSTDQLGYGYIGINAGKVEDLELRKAIMAAMNTALGKQYYVTGTAETIYWPMSLVSWAYPTDGGAPDRDNGKEYIAINFNRSDAISMIKDYMAQANATEGDSRLKITFTIAGANVDDHPCYSIFMEAQSILNECGWDISVVPDTQALTKLSTGSLAVWAAAWGSTIDPDMYQVYHKDSTATSTLAWGYNAIKSNQSKYEEENSILGQLSDVIDRARETDDKDERKALYKEAMGYVLDLAIELPVYQRDVLYAYDSNVIDKDSLPSKEELNPYSSPLDKIWELDFAD